MESLSAVLEQLGCNNLTIKQSKCLIGYVKLPFSGHVIGEEQYACQSDKTVKVRDAQTSEKNSSEVIHVFFFFLVRMVIREGAN